MTNADPTTIQFTAPAYLDEPAADGPDATPAAPPEPGTDAPPADALPPGDSEPPGKRLAARLAADLVARGWHVDYHWATYTGHAFDARRLTDRYDVELTLVDLATAAWQLVAKRRAGLLRNLFKRRPNEAESAEHRLLRTHLEEALWANPEFAVRELPGGNWQLGVD